MWALDDISSCDQAHHVAEAIRQGMAIAATDGSFKSQVVTAACCLEGPSYGHKRVSATCRSPGHPEDQDAYRAELSGVLMVICVVKHICCLHRIKSGGITPAYNGLEAIIKAMDPNTYYSCRSNQFDLISAIDNKLLNSLLTWRWSHVKGHQDDRIRPLDRWATLNIEMDSFAKHRRWLEEGHLSNPP